MMTVQTIEKTSKNLKAWMMACWAGVALGIFCMCSGGLTHGFYILLAGVGGVICVKVLIWWRHG